MLELLAVPQRGVPYVQMGFRIVLYISNLFSSDSFDFLPMIQYNGIARIKFLACQTHSINQYKNIRSKVLKCCANIYFNL
jgi:hypothetical protein